MIPGFPRVQKIDKKRFQESSQFPGVLKLLEKLQDSGFQALLAGGCVRDIFLGRIPKDFDVATSATPAQVHALFPKTVSLGERFGTVGVLIRDVLYQVTTFRTEGAYRDGRHPEEISYSDPRRDALRRDFTINGLFADPLEGQIVDYVEGLKDLEKGVIRAIGMPSNRFQEDALRLMRAARFSARFQFPIEKETQRSICTLASTVLRVSAERIRDELMMILTEGDPAAGIRTLDELNLLHAILPEVTAMKGVEQPLQFHPEGDVFSHTLIVLEKIEPKDSTLLLAALLHDVGKPPTFEVTDRIRFNRHAAVGAKMAEKIMRRLAFSNAEISAVVSLVEEHLYIADLPKMREGKRRRFLRRPDIERHLELHRADCLASHGKLEIYDFCKEQLASLAQEDLHPKRLITGKDLIELGYRPGPLFKKILGELEEAQMEGRIRSKEEAQRWVKNKFPN